MNKIYKYKKNECGKQGVEIIVLKKFINYLMNVFRFTGSLFYIYVFYITEPFIFVC